VAVCGDVDPSEVRRMFEKLLKGWKRGAPLQLSPPEFPARGVRAEAFRAQRAQVHVYLGHLGIARSHPTTCGSW
jgi:predicted Zn-dependent peptidase